MSLPLLCNNRVLVFFIYCSVFLPTLLVHVAFAGDYAGRVISIQDGDTIEVLHSNHAERIRLQGIDCPEKRQAFGNRAKQATSALVFGNEVTMQTYGKDKYKRTIADVILSDGTNVNHELVKEGWCWWYRKYAPNDAELEQLETQAREAKKGLWSDPEPIPPWVYRKARQKKGMDMSDLDQLEATSER